MTDAVYLSTPSHLAYYGTCANCKEAYRPNLCLEREADVWRPEINLCTWRRARRERRRCRRADRIRRRWEQEKEEQGFLSSFI